MDPREWLAGDSAAIFLFHGVTERPRHALRNYTQKHLALERFRDLLQQLKSAGQSVSMADLVAAFRGDTELAPRAFAVTFDDGFENNFRLAAPVLSDLGIPATFYVTTGFIETNGSSWIDMIEYAFEKSPTVRLDMPFPPGRVSSCTREEKLTLLDLIRQRVKGDKALDPYAFAQDVWKQLGVVAMEPDPDLDQKMSWAQVETLSRSALFMVGGHGHTHRILEYLSHDDLGREIATSCDILRKHIGAPLHYSYPEGLDYCYSDRVIAMLKAQGIVCAPSAQPGTNRAGDDLFRLKRVMVA